MSMAQLSGGSRLDRCASSSFGPCGAGHWKIQPCPLEVFQASDGLRLKHERQDEYQKRQRRKNFTHVEFSVIH